MGKETIYKNEELYNIMSALGIENDLEGLRYGQVIIATDADYRRHAHPQPPADLLPELLRGAGHARARPLPRDPAVPRAQQEGRPCTATAQASAMPPSAGAQGPRDHALQGPGRDQPEEFGRSSAPTCASSASTCRPSRQCQRSWSSTWARTPPSVASSSCRTSSATSNRASDIREGMMAYVKKIFNENYLYYAVLRHQGPGRSPTSRTGSSRCSGGYSTRSSRWTTASSIRWPTSSDIACSTIPTATPRSIPPSSSSRTRNSSSTSRATSATSRPATRPRPRATSSAGSRPRQGSPVQAQDHRVRRILRRPQQRAGRLSRRKFPSSL